MYQQLPEANQFHFPGQKGNPKTSPIVPEQTEVRFWQIHSLLKPLLEKFGHHILADILSRFTFVRIQKAASNNPPSIRDICLRFLCACIPGMHERNPEDPKSLLSTAESSPPAAIGQVDDHRDKSHSLRQQRSRPTERTGE